MSVKIESSREAFHLGIAQWLAEHWIYFALSFVGLPVLTFIAGVLARSSHQFSPDEMDSDQRSLRRVAEPEVLDPVDGP